MVDVVFLLIIFFMTTAQFSRLNRAEVSLPQERGEQKETAEEAGLVVNITRAGDLIVADQTVDLEGLERLIREELRASEQDRSGLKLLIRADRDGDTRRLNELVNLLTELGLGQARLATEVPPRLGGAR